MGFEIELNLSWSVEYFVEVLVHDQYPSAILTNLKALDCNAFDNFFFGVRPVTDS